MTYPENPSPALRKTCTFRQADVDAFLTVTRDEIAAKLPGVHVEWLQLYDQYQHPTGALLHLNGHKALRLSYRDDMNPHLMADSFYMKADGPYIQVNKSWMALVEFTDKYGAWL